MNIDVVMLSYAKDDQFRQLTQTCIDSLHKATVRHQLGVYVVETNPERVDYLNTADVIHPRCKFNYNKFLNIGFRHVSAPLILISNNDVIYHEGCLDILCAFMDKHSLTSASPRCPAFYAHAPYTDETLSFGYATSYQFCGWALLVSSTILEKIVPLDEEFPFHYQDNDMAERMQELGGTHALIGKAKATHLLNQSHRLLPEGELQATTLQGERRLLEKRSS